MVHVSCLLLTFYMLIDPLQNQIGDLQIIFVLHKHVAVPKLSKFRQMHHDRVASRRIHLVNHLLARFESSRPQVRMPRNIPQVIAEDHEDWNSGESRNLRGSQRRWAFSLDRDRALQVRWIDECRSLREKT